MLIVVESGPLACLVHSLIMYVIDSLRSIGGRRPRCT